MRSTGGLGWGGGINGKGEGDQIPSLMCRKTVHATSSSICHVSAGHGVTNAPCQYRTWHSGRIPAYAMPVPDMAQWPNTSPMVASRSAMMSWLGPGTAPYATSIPDTAEQARRPTAPHARSVPDRA
eukprot:192713-Rhodomonas_salina.3